MKKIKLYDLHGGSATANYITLLSPDNKWFYWDNKQFKKYEKGDIVFWINRIARKALYTVLEDASITPDFKDGKNYIREADYEVSANAQNAQQFETFIKFDVIEIRDIPDGWNYSDPSTFQNQLMAYILFEENISEKEKRISKLEDLSVIFTAGAPFDIINEAIEILGGINSIERKVWFVTQGSTFTPERGMKFLWAPEKGKGNTKRFYWDNLLKVKQGDIIFNYSEGLKGVSIASSDGYKAENIDKNSQWESQGFRVEIELTPLTPPISRSELSNQKDKIKKHLQRITNKPFDTNGKVNEGYLYEFTKEAGRFIRDIYGKNFGNKIIDDFFNKVSLKETAIMKRDMEYDTILNAIKTKPFILLAGLSGSGKSRLVRTLAFKTCAKEELRKDVKKPGNFELIPVRPNWHDSTELMGYTSRINGDKYITTTFLQFIARAWKNLDIPFFLCLDEMNLAPAEQYFAEYLSIIETRQNKADAIVTDYLLSKSNFKDQDLYSQIINDLDLQNDSKFEYGIGIPNNLVVIGTVNMDETTHSFSRKILDRAMTFEMNEVDLGAGLDLTKNDWEYPSEFISSSDLIGEFTAGNEVVNLYQESKNVIEFLEKINAQLNGSPFKIAYRVRDEFLIYCYYANKNKNDSNWLQNSLDEMTNMKILSRIEGDETKTGNVLRNLQKILTPDYKRSNSKLREMETRLLNSGYTSYWS